MRGDLTAGAGGNGGPIRPRRPEKLPAAIRPGDTDDVLEGPRLMRISVWGLVLSLIMAAFIFLYWVNEPHRLSSTTTHFQHQAVERGRSYFAAPTDPQTGAPNHRGIGCTRCHGNDATGGTNTFLNSNTGQQQTVPAPDLTTVFKRYAKPPIGYKTAKAYIQETIERGRTLGALGDGDDMPTWGLKNGGPLTDQQISDIIDFLVSSQKKAS